MDSGIKMGGEASGLIGQNVGKSTKAIGKFEKPLIAKVARHFRRLGYKTYPHARLNIAWSGALSDLDLLLVKRDELTAIEVKSIRDKLSKAKSQILRISDYIDYGYVVAERSPRCWDEVIVGLLVVDKERITCIKKAKRFTGRPSVESLAALHKKCLLRFLGNGHNSHLLKWDIAREVRLLGSEESLRRCLKEIVTTCGEGCDTDCPILRFTARHVPSPQSLFGWDEGPTLAP